MQKMCRFLLIAMITMLGCSSYAGVTNVSQYIDVTQITTGKQVRVVDKAAAYETPSGNFAIMRSSKVRLTYMRKDRNDVMSSTVSGPMNYWIYQVKYKIYSAAAPSVFDTANVMVSFGTDIGSSVSVYEDIRTHSLTASDVVVEVTAVVAVNSSDGITYSTVSSPQSSTSIPDDIRLEAIISTEKYEDLNTSTLNRIYFKSTDSTLNWSYIPGAEEYDVEWTFIDSADHHASFANPNDPFDYKAGTRITTSAQSYRIDLTYPSGTLYFRVRGVGRFINSGSDYTHPKPGSWSYHNDPLLSPITYAISNGGFDKSKNWQYVISFAEEGKYKKVMTYMDGSLRKHQVLTYISSDNTTVIGETKYDYEGRGAVSILPAPVSGNDLSYHKRFTTDSTATGEFERTDFEPTVHPVGNGNGAGKYYSASNPFTSDPFKNYIPDAGGALTASSTDAGFPYTQTVFTRDNTGRVAKQSGVGPDHRIGSTHETKMFYGTANSTELHRMFGTNTGVASHYKKTITLDPNKQISCIYMDQEGRTVATSLAGDSPSNLIALDSNYTEALTVSLNGNNVVDSANHRSTTVASILNVVPGTVHTFSYDMNGAIYTNSFSAATHPTPTSVSVCTDCKYKLSIRILDPNGIAMTILDPTYGSVTELKRDISNSVSANCSNTQYTTGVITFAMTFPDIGNYTVLKELTLDTAGLAAQVQSAISAAGLGSTFLSSLTQDYRDAVDTSLCDISCEQYCKTRAKELFPSYNVDQLAEVIDSLMTADCDGAISSAIDSATTYSCEGLLQLMKYDVDPESPNGPGWAYTEDTTGEFWTNVKSMITATTLVIHHANGSVWSPAPSVTYMSNSSNWESQWADDLVKAHREYCHYTACTGKITSSSYDAKMAMMGTWTQANYPVNSYLDPLNLTDANIHSPSYSIGTNTGNLDPYFAGAGNTAKRNVMINKTKNHPVYGNIWEYASNSSNTTLYNTNNPYNDTNRWRTWRGLYLQIKQELIDSIEKAGCPFYTDDRAIVVEPPHYTTQSVVSDAITNNSWLQYDVYTTCLQNVQMWMDSLSEYCGVDTSNYSLSTINTIRDSLMAYCQRSTGPANPLGLVTDEAVTSGELNNVKTLLSALSPASSCGNSVACFSTPTPYAHCTSDTVTSEVVETCFKEALRLLNDNIFTNYTPSSGGTCYTLSSYSSYDLSCVPSGKTKLHVYNDKFDYDDNTCSNSGCGPWFRFYKNSSGTAVAVNTADIISVTSPLYMNASPITSGATGTFRNVMVTVNSIYGPYLAYVYGSTGSGCVALTRSISQVICVVDSIKNDMYSYTMNLDTLRKHCIEQQLAEADFNAQQAYNDLVNDFTSQYIANLYANCFSSSLSEDFYYEYDSKEYQYTLYYYDQAANLVQTVPPQGVHLVPLTAFTNGVYNGSTEPAHTYKTRYLYNSLNHSLRDSTPDADITKFLYDTKGRMVASQNAKQRLTNYTYSYTLYDSRSRVIEVGQVTNTGTDLTTATAEDATLFATWLAAGTKEQVTKTHYDNNTGSPLAQFTTGTQDNLRSRVASVTIADGVGNSSPVTYGTYYSYDEHGNVKELVQDNAALSALNNDTLRYKKIAYTYDLVSNKVNEVAYQKGRPDQFWHRYEYDADNRITIAMTSSDGEIWEKDAKYFYYKHGPMARFEIGEDKVQAMDYAYALHGWIKGVNSNTLNTARDMGKDGNAPSNIIDATNRNNLVGQDAFGFTLGYYDKDYSSIGTSSFQATVTTTSNTIGDATWNLFNGNISHMVTALAGQNAVPMTTQGVAYKYDQLNRLKEASVYRNYTSSDQVAANNTWSGAGLIGSGLGDYAERYAYDCNGNITKLLRNGITSVGQKMDSLTYKYNVSSTVFTNKLIQVRDSIGSGVYTVDIDDQGANNYDYDAIGNLIKDDQEEIASIEWTVYGKIRKVNRISSSTKDDLEFRYDPMGNRICKISKPRAGSAQKKEEDWTYTYYVRDAQGNAMAVYNRDVNVSSGTVTDKTFLKELDIYGSSRVGMKNCNIHTGGITYTAATPNAYDSDGKFTITGTTNVAADAIAKTKRTIRKKTYELTNHLGNVIVAVSDKKIGVSTSGTTLPIANTYYLADVQSANDYYSFGMLMEGRQYSGSGYRYGFNGMENDPEIVSTGQGTQDYGFRIYNPALGKFLSVDPLTDKYPMLTPYQFASNRPIASIDIDGLEAPPLPGDAQILSQNGGVNTTTDMNNQAGTGGNQASPTMPQPLAPLNLSTLTGTQQEMAAQIGQHFVNAMERQLANPLSPLNTTGQVPTNQIFTNIGGSVFPIGTAPITFTYTAPDGGSPITAQLQLNNLTGAPNEFFMTTAPAAGFVGGPGIFQFGQRTNVGAATDVTGNPVAGNTVQNMFRVGTNLGGDVRILSQVNNRPVAFDGRTVTRQVDADDLMISIGSRLNHGLILRDRLIIWNERSNYPNIPLPANTRARQAFPVGTRLGGVGFPFQSDGDFTR